MVLNSIQLSDNQQRMIYKPTPIQYVKTRKIRGGGMANYVETGYVIDQLNKTFGQANWNFQVIRETIDTKSVAVYGELSVVDHVKGFKITKGQYGSKEKYPEIPIGDTLKAAASDCLKKCASSGFGVALDVYYKELDLAGKDGSKPAIALPPPREAESKDDARQRALLNLMQMASEYGAPISKELEYVEKKLGKKFAWGKCTADHIAKIRTMLMDKMIQR